MAYEISGDTAKLTLLGALLVSPIVASLGTAYWGGHIVSSLAHAGLLRTGILATVQSVAGFVIGMFFRDSILKSLVSSQACNVYIAQTGGRLVAGGLVYAIGALAVKAGLVSTALTLPAAAALVIVPAVTGSATLFLTDKLIDLARSLDCIEVVP